MRRRGRSNRVPHYPASPGVNPTVAILGRPNVGKSTLFNRLVGRHAAIVQDQPGVTRDRIYAEADINGRPITLVDTGGWEYDPETPTASGINRQCRTALEEASVVLFVVDGRSALTNGDIETAQLLRRISTPVLLVVNKIDGDRHEATGAEMYALGMEDMVMVSAAHGRNFDELEDVIFNALPASHSQPPLPVIFDDVSKNAMAEDPSTPHQHDLLTDDPLAEDPPEYAVRVAVIGRPNAGKSTLINALLQEERLLTMDQPGTTRDAVDTHVKMGKKEYVFVDTAGIRRKSKVRRDSPEHLAVGAAVAAMQRCRVVVLMIDADDDVAEQDAKILGLAVDRGRAVVIAMNKWDRLKGNAHRQKQQRAQLTEKLTFVPWARHVTISATQRTGLHKLLKAIDDANTQFCQRVSTGRLNALFQDIVDHHPPPLRKGRPVKLYFATQISVRPPTFVIQTSYPEALHFSYRRYVENRIRDAFGFEGSPIKLVFKKRARRGD